MKLSIIVPVYKVEPYLRRCVDSILAQTFTDFELILVDDGSPDNCPAICDEYAQKDSRVKVIHKENGGLSDARNAGLDIAQGEYIGFVDSDDYIHPQMYELLYKTITANHSDVVHSGWERTTDGHMIPNNKYVSDYPNVEVICSDPLSDVFYPRIWNTVPGIMCVKLFKREIWDTIRFPVGHTYEDIWILPDLLGKCKKLVLLNLPLYYYYTRNDSIVNSTAQKPQFVLDHLLVYQHHYNFYQKHRKKSQMYRAEAAMLTVFTMYKLNPALSDPTKKGDYSCVDRFIRNRWVTIFLNPEICKMQKLVFLMLYLNPQYALKLCKKYYPECVPSELR